MVVKLGVPKNSEEITVSCEMGMNFIIFNI